MSNQGFAPSMASTASQGSAVDSQAWEVKIIVLEAKKMNDPKFVDPLNDLAAQGWEPVTMSPYDALIKYMAFYFKRPKRR